MAIKLGLFLVALCGTLAFVAANEKPVTIAPTLKCHHHDYMLVGKSCIKKDIVQPTSKCPKHGRLHEGKCILHEHVSGTMKCPKGYEMVGKKCVSNSVSSFVYECPAHHYVPVPQAHGKGPGECVKETHSKTHSSCPDGYKMSHDGVCFRQTYDKASIVCPKGYTPDKKGCAISEPVSPLFSCPKHYTLQGNANCVKDKTEEKKCPHGWNLVTIGGKDECERIILRDASPMCASGVMDDHKHMCLSSAQEKPRFVCKHKNATYMNGKCIRVIEEDASIECSHGYKFDGKHCVKKTNTPPEYKCTKTETLVKNKCQSVEKAPLAGCVGFECMREKIKPADIKCPEGAKMGEKGCEMIVRVDSNKICENKGELRHNKCVYYDQKEPLVSCKQGQPTKDGKCVLRDIIPMIARCDKGFKPSEDAKGCVKSEHTHPNMVCPPNSAVKGGKCIVEVVTKAPVECPHGYTYDVKGCIKMHEQAPVLVCPKDLKLVNQTCVPKHQEKEKHKKEPCLKEKPCVEAVPIIGKSESVVHVQPDPVVHHKQPAAVHVHPDAHSTSPVFEHAEHTKGMPVQVIEDAHTITVQPEHDTYMSEHSHPAVETFVPEHSHSVATYQQEEPVYIAHDKTHLQ